MRTVKRLYIHIPYCHFLCHYCDFAKTARFDRGEIQKYFLTLRLHLQQWIEYLESRKQFDGHFETVYIGGGTPSMFSHEYEDIFADLNSYITKDCEVTLEANPKDLSKYSIDTWRALGINRLSIGVQSFLTAGQTALTRQHSYDDCIKSIELAKPIIPNLNIDLIYGWPKQTLAEWQSDLNILQAIKPTHISLYCLTYAAKTPIGRAYSRGKLPQQNDLQLESYYNLACKDLKTCGYWHEEVSNWHLPSFPGKHNQGYWQMDYYLGIGTGAHGFIPSSEDFIGIRYFYSDRPKQFTPILKKNISENDTLTQFGVSIDDRDINSWLIETVTNGLRTFEGVSLDLISEVSGKTWTPSPRIESAIKDDLLKLENGYLKLDSLEWFRESSWSLEVIDCFF